MSSKKPKIYKRSGNTHKKEEICQYHSCNNSSVTTCKFCNQKFCGYHSPPTLVLSHTEITRLTSEDFRKDPRKYNKMMEDWNRTDGHPCTEYANQWNRGAYVGYVAEQTFNSKPLQVPEQKSAPQGILMDKTRIIPSKKTQIEERKAPETKLKVDDTINEIPPRVYDTSNKIPLLIGLAFVIALATAIWYNLDYLPNLSNMSNSTTTTITSTQLEINQTNASEFQGIQSILLMNPGFKFSVNTFPNNYYGVSFMVPTNTYQVNVTGEFSSKKPVELIVLNQTEFYNFTKQGRFGFPSLFKTNINGTIIPRIGISQPGKYYAIFLNPYNTSGIYTNITAINPFVVSYLLNSSKPKTTTTSTSSTTTSTIKTSTAITTLITSTVPTTTVNMTNVPQNNTQLTNYALSLINKDRQQYGLQNVTLASTTSGQQHAISMLDNNYFSHWDIYGLKPYMRYTLVGGIGAVSENIAYQSGSTCVSFVCNGDISAQSDLQQMEYSMMYNDLACCENGHRDNILEPYHNQVSIGIAYNSGTIYFVEDFIDNYVNWNSNSPSYTNNQVYLSGNVKNGATFSSVEVSYDPPVTNMSQSALNSTFSYSYGTSIAGVVDNSGYYYTTIATIVANQYSVNGNQFNLNFNIQKMISQYGAGEYTMLVWLNDSSGNSFVGATYTIFINKNGESFASSNV